MCKGEFFAIEDWLSNWTMYPARGRFYDPSTHDVVPKREYIQEEIDRLSNALKQAEENEKAQKKYWRDRQHTIEEKIAGLTKRLED